MTLILDVGCGPNKVKDAFGIDIVRMDGVNAVVDLFHLPLPFADDIFDEIYFNDWNCCFSFKYYDDFN